MLNPKRNRKITEPVLMAGLNHKHIIRMRAHFMMRGFNFLVIDYCEKGDLCDYVYENEYLDEDVLCVGDSDEGKEIAMELAAAVTGRRGISAGKLRLARQLEPFTAVLISINRKYKAHSGIRITGLPEGD